MSRLALRTLVIVAGCTLLAAGCDDEVTTPPDAAALAKDGGSSDGATADVAAPAGDGSVDAPATGDVAVLGPDAAPLTAQQARGQYLMDHVIGCPECHTPHDAMGAPVPGMYLAGWDCLIKLPNGHCLSSRNLTNDPTGLKNRMDDEIKSMFQNGIRPAATGGGATLPTALNPFMPYYVFHNMDAEDADAIVAYLRTVPGVNHTVKTRDVEFDVPAHANYLDPATIPMPQAGTPNMESALHGRYLAAKSGLCIECHTKHNDPPSLDVLTPANFFAGGEAFPLGFPVTPVSLNLTSDNVTGIGTWSVDDIVTVLHQGKDKKGMGICPPMPVGPMGAYGGISYQDTLDIANYIKSLPPVVNAIVDMCSFPFGPPPMTDGGVSPDGAMSIDGASTDGSMSSTDGATVDTAATTD
jgi:hypothetical protein